jgi:hypothetical protein
MATTYLRSDDLARAVLDWYHAAVVGDTAVLTRSALMGPLRLIRQSHAYVYWSFGNRGMTMLLEQALARLQMLPPHHAPPESFTPGQIAAWMDSTHHKCLALHLLFAEPSTNRDLAFVRMSDLVQESLEEVRVLSATLQEGSQGLRTRARQLRERSTALYERSHRAREQRLQDRPSAK